MCTYIQTGIQAGRQAYTHTHTYREPVIHTGRQSYIHEYTRTPINTERHIHPATYIQAHIYT